MKNLYQAEIVKKSLDLEILIDNTKRTLEKLIAERFSSEPNPPVCESIQVTYPEIKSNIKINWLVAVLPFVADIILTSVFAPIGFLFWPTLIWIPVYCFVIHKKKKKTDVERIRNSVEYRTQCTNLDEEFNKRQKIANQKYEVEKSTYENETLPSYNKALEEWTAQHSQKVSTIRAELEKAESTLSELYAETKIVPLQYRQIVALQYIYNMISSSNYSIKEAIESFDKNEQRELEMMKIQEQQRANRLANEANQLANEQADLLAEQNEIASKARRDANIASGIGMVQRHNTNKYLKKK